MQKNQHFKILILIFIEFLSILRTIFVIYIICDAQNYESNN
jgi:hypothetical protein